MPWNQKSARLTSDPQSRSSEVLYPVIYASAALNVWGVQSFLGRIKHTIKGEYYPEGQEAGDGRGKR